jgi:hypothetical protein
LPTTQNDFQSKKKMSLNYQEVREQVRKLGENAPARRSQLESVMKLARATLTSYAGEIELLRQKVGLVVSKYDPGLRCALPVDEALDASFPAPQLPTQASILAADGSQINLDRHAEVAYCLINVGAIQMSLGAHEQPRITVTSQLFYDEDLNAITENSLALKRDLHERQILAKLANGAQAPVFTFTDGPMELWGGKETDGAAATEYQESLEEYLECLTELRQLGVVTGGYVDKPAASPVMRLLEVAITPETGLGEIRQQRPLRGATDFAIYQGLLAPGERSAVFAIQSQSARSYRGDLALHFFYLNVGRADKPWLARVEAPAWVARTPELLNGLHAVLVDQCRILGTRPYPYLLHRAHETALVTLQDRDQVTQMIALELRRQGIPIQGSSYKQANKDLPGRTRYQP